MSDVESSIVILYFIRIWQYVMRKLSLIRRRWIQIVKVQYIGIQRFVVHIKMVLSYA